MRNRQTFLALTLGAAVVLLMGTLADGVLGRMLSSETGAGGASETPPGLPAARPRPALVLGFSTSYGLSVTHVVPGSPAGRAGLRLGDRVVSFNDIPMNDAQTLKHFDGKPKPDAIPVDLIRTAEGGRFPVKISIQPVETPSRTEFPMDTPAKGGVGFASELGFTGVYGSRVLGTRLSDGTVVNPPEGLLQGDVIFRINDESVNRNGKMRELVNSAPKGTEFTVHHLRFDPETESWTVHTTRLKSRPYEEVYGPKP